jgi:hypothetical protein
LCTIVPDRAFLISGTSVLVLWTIHLVSSQWASAILYSGYRVHGSWICVEYGWVRFNGRERFDDGNDGRGPMVQMAMRCLDHVLLLTPCSTHTSRRRAVPPRAPVLASPRVLILACADLLHRWDLEGGHGLLASCFLVSILGRRGRPPSTRSA